MKRPEAEPVLAFDLERYRGKAYPDLLTYASIDATLESAAAAIPEGAWWSFFLGKVAPSAGTDWTKAGFDDASWEAGRSGLGYGEDRCRTWIGKMRGRYSTLYLRRRFTLPARELLERVTLSIRASGGFVAYLNGSEVGRAHTGAADSEVPHDAEATSRPAGPPRSHVYRIDLSSLRSGPNVLAIQGVNRSKDSTQFCITPVLRSSLRPSVARDQVILDRFLALPDRQKRTGRTTDALAQYFRGRVLQRAGRHEEAMAEFDRLLANDRSQPEPWLRAAECLRALGRSEAAQARIREALAGGVIDDGVLWDRWFVLTCVDLKQDAAAALAVFPTPSSGTATGRGQKLNRLLGALAARRAVRINCGGEEFTGSGGRAWWEDCFFTSGIACSELERAFEGEITGTTDDVLYRTARSFTETLHPPGYRIPLPAGRYRVRLHFAETVHRKAGRRRVVVLLEGTEFLKDPEPLDAGFATAHQRFHELSVVDGFLDVHVYSLAGYPSVAALEIEMMAP